jgi:acetyl-CoA acetyltransferase family protein
MNKVAIVGGRRTPFVKAGGVFRNVSNIDLAIHAVTSTVEALQLDVARIDELWFSTVLLDPRVPQFAREIVLRSALPSSLGAHFVSNNCISGLVAATCGAQRIASGHVHTVLAGGSESMSCPSLSWQPAAERFFLKLFRARTFMEKLQVLGQVRPNFFLPVPPSPKEPSTGLTMGQHCEITAKQFQISREAQDKLAFLSHQRAAAAQDQGLFAHQITPLSNVAADNLVRKETTLEKLTALPPVFDKKGGTLTAGNSSALTDGASCVCLMSHKAAEQSGQEVLASLVDYEYAAVDPQDGLLMAPGLAVPRLLKRRGLSFADIDVFEIHEAFGAQVLSNMEVWKSGWKAHPEIAPIGEVPEDKLNIYGGSMALGHPFAATGGRLIMNLAQILHEKQLRRGLISICAAGAMAGAVLLERE